MIDHRLIDRSALRQGAGGSGIRTIDSKALSTRAPAVAGARAGRSDLIFRTRAEPSGAKPSLPLDRRGADSRLHNNWRPSPRRAPRPRGLLLCSLDSARESSRAALRRLSVRRYTNAHIPYIFRLRRGPVDRQPAEWPAAALCE